MQRASSNVDTSQGDCPAGVTDHLVLALQALYRAYQKTSIYPPGHPAVPQALSEASLELERAIDRDSILIGVAPSHLAINGEALQESSGTARSLAHLLYDLDVTGIELGAGLTAGHLQIFVDLLTRARREGVRGAALVAMLQEQQLDGLRLVPLDYDALSFAEGPREGGVPDQPGAWKDLYARLTDPSLALDSTPDEMAIEIARELERREGTGIGDLRGSIRQASNRIQQLQPADRAEMRRRLAQVVTALNPDLRGDLLRVDPRRPGRALSLMVELADVVPEPDLLDALQELDRVGARVPEQVLTLMNKLVRMSRSRPTLLSGLEDTLGRWGVSPQILHEDTPDLRSALEELFHTRKPVDCNPQAYQALLVDLSRAEIEGADIPLESRYRDPRDKADVRLHAAEVAVQALGRAGGDKHRVGLLGRIETTSGDLLDQRRFGVLRDAAVSARSYSLLRDQPAVTRQSASAFLEEYTKPARIRHIIERACSDDAVPKAALSLLGLGGEEAVTQALDALADEERPAVVEVLQGFVLRDGAPGIARLVDERYDGGWQRLRALVRLLPRLGLEDASPLLRKLWRHPEGRVRLGALVCLCEMDRGPGREERHLSRALSDADRCVVDHAVERLSQMNTAASIAALGQCLEGTFATVMPSPRHLAQLADALSSSGPAGLERLCACLDRSSWTLRPRMLLVGQIVHRTLADRADQPDVARCLKRWRRAVCARLIGGWIARLHGVGSERE